MIVGLIVIHLNSKETGILNFKEMIVFDDSNDIWPLFFIEIIMMAMEKGLSSLGIKHYYHIQVYYTAMI